MTKRLFVIGGVAVAAMAAALAVMAQGAHGIPAPEKVYGDGVTWPIKIERRDYDKRKLLAQPAMSEDALTGRVLWLQKCAYCHDGVGAPTYKTMGPWLGAEIIQSLGEETVRSFIRNGDVRMPAFRYNLSDPQINSVMEFLKTVKADQKPTPAQLSGRGFAGAASD